MKALHLTNELQEQRESSEQRQDNGEAETEDQPSDGTTTKSSHTSGSLKLLKSMALSQTLSILLNLL